MSYLKEIYNYVQLSSIVLILIVIPLRFLDLRSQWVLLALGYMLTTIRIFKFISASRLVVPNMSDYMTLPCGLDFWHQGRSQNWPKGGAHLQFEHFTRTTPKAGGERTSNLGIWQGPFQNQGGCLSPISSPLAAPGNGLQTTCEEIGMYVTAVWS